ncbi:MAG TPA: transglutaminase family protein [Acidimicrobiales bacterium]
MSAGAGQHVGCTLGFEVEEPATLALQVAVARAATLTLDETLHVTVDGVPHDGPVRELTGDHGSRFHVVDAPKGVVTITYEAAVAATVPDPIAATELELLAYLRPSRYCPSDRLVGWATGEFGHLGRGHDAVRAITDWIGRRLAYVLGSSAPTDGAVDTLMAGQGVCRDFAHLGVTICRGLDIPARAVAVYAPGLWPMDFHAVFEAYTGDAWHVHDATRLAPRQGLVRIATGRDAADTAFATVIGGRAELRSTEITAVADGALPEDRWDLPVILP